MAGAPGFFRPRMPAAMLPFSSRPALSFDDTGPLAAKLKELVGYDYLNGRGPRLSVGATDVETGKFAYFDSARMRLDVRHLMASGALPPGCVPVQIDGRFYWDGGLFSNTPLRYVMENAEADALCIFQIDLFNAEREIPRDLADVQQREKDIRYFSRTRLTTDRCRHLHALRAAADRLPAELRDDPDLALLRAAGPTVG